MGGRLTMIGLHRCNRKQNLDVTNLLLKIWEEIAHSLALKLELSFAGLTVKYMFMN